MENRINQRSNRIDHTVEGGFKTCILILKWKAHLPCFLELKREKTYCAIRNVCPVMLEQEPSVAQNQVLLGSLLDGTFAWKWAKFFSSLAVGLLRKFCHNIARKLGWFVFFFGVIVVYHVYSIYRRMEELIKHPIKCHVFTFLILIFLILIVTCAEISVVLCYFQLCSKDCLW